MSEREQFEPTTKGPTGLFLNTNALFAYCHPNTDEHRQATAFLEAIGDNEIPYRPLYTSIYVVDKLVMLLLSKGSHDLATSALERTLDSEHVSVIPESESAFTAARIAFERYDDHSISFTDHLSAVQMQERDIDHVFACDRDCSTLGFEQFPR